MKQLFLTTAILLAGNLFCSQGPSLAAAGLLNTEKLHAGKPIAKKDVAPSLADIDAFVFDCFKGLTANALLFAGTYPDHIHARATDNRMALHATIDGYVQKRPACYQIFEFLTRATKNTLTAAEKNEMHNYLADVFGDNISDKKVAKCIEALCKVLEKEWGAFDTTTVPSATAPPVAKRTIDHTMLPDAKTATKDLLGKKTHDLPAAMPVKKKDDGKDSTKPPLGDPKGSSKKSKTSLYAEAKHKTVSDTAKKTVAPREKKPDLDRVPAHKKESTDLAPAPEKQPVSTHKKKKSTKHRSTSRERNQRDTSLEMNSSSLIKKIGIISACVCTAGLLWWKFQKDNPIKKEPNVQDEETH